jgi:uncharacterized membrane protein
VGYQDWIEAASRAVDAAGVLAVVMGAVLATVFAVTRVVRRKDEVYRRFRRSLGRSIRRGPELLVAADIIRTVAVMPTLESTNRGLSTLRANLCKLEKFAYFHRMSNSIPAHVP